MPVVAMFDRPWRKVAIGAVIVEAWGFEDSYDL
jgi:hypothetical protein